VNGVGTSRRRSRDLAVKPPSSQNYTCVIAGPPGFEPGLTDPESVGLPLPHGPVRGSTEMLSDWGAGTGRAVPSPLLLTRVWLERRVQAATERHGRCRSSPQFVNTLDQSPVGGHHAYGVGRWILRHDPDDLMVGGIPPSPRSEHHGDGTMDVRWNAGWLPIEHNGHVFARGRGVSVEFVDEGADGPVRIVPPPVWSGADHVHTVDQPPHARVVVVLGSPCPESSWPSARILLPVAAC
jgi:hypothetical protein